MYYIYFIRILQYFLYVDTDDKCAAESSPKVRISTPLALTDISNQKKKDRVNFYRHVIEGVSTTTNEKPEILNSTVPSKRQKVL